MILGLLIAAYFTALAFVIWRDPSNLSGKHTHTRRDT